MKKDISLEQTAVYTKENMIDVIALGFDPKKTHFIIDTTHAGILYKEAVKVAKKITLPFNEFINIFPACHLVLNVIFFIRLKRIFSKINPPKNPAIIINTATIMLLIVNSLII